jgi:hypothetical protein
MEKKKEPIRCFFVVFPSLVLPPLFGEVVDIGLELSDCTIDGGLVWQLEGC